jgi:hypothetical protein
MVYWVGATCFLLGLIVGAIVTAIVFIKGE